MRVGITRERPRDSHLRHWRRRDADELRRRHDVARFIRRCHDETLHAHVPPQKRHTVRGRDHQCLLARVPGVSDRQRRRRRRDAGDKSVVRVGVAC